MVIHEDANIENKESEIKQVEEYSLPQNVQSLDAEQTLNIEKSPDTIFISNNNEVGEIQQYVEENSWPLNEVHNRSVEQALNMESCTDDRFVASQHEPANEASNLKKELCRECNDSLFFYKRLLNVYNCTVYYIVNKPGHCYLWDETLGGKGCDEKESEVWNDIKKIFMQATNPFAIYYLDTYQPDSTMKCFNVRHKMRGKPNNETLVLTNKYRTHPGISNLKKKDLISLCDGKVIPSVYWDYYKTLPASSDRADDD
ncbi:unnamed protein product [Parnassius apollo]|uniref:(apollo) hypothetical protein n=1 Tax=Parnassius apollo TaxID=110799 RepID=A0A8S3WQI7_PARAO|nr:unnamed protein product [Parnassius apollo]